MESKHQKIKGCFLLVRYRVRGQRSRVTIVDHSTGFPLADVAVPPRVWLRPWCLPGQILHLHPALNHSWEGKCHSCEGD
uniref:Uncharacterized protein n=1 Tax=Anguilla anguilla TaxID=7936 RepID=A0A0E9WSK1_ANGAN